MPSQPRSGRAPFVQCVVLVTAGLLLLDGCAYCRPPTKEQMMARQEELKKEGFTTGEACRPGADAIVGLVDFLVNLF